MINKSMSNVNSSDNKTTGTRGPDKKPNEVGGVCVSSHVKIFDPNTGQVLMQKRGDD